MDSTSKERTMQLSTNPVNTKNLGQIERWASVLGGASLVAYGMKKRTVGPGLMAILGGDLIYRGLSGYSLLYDALGKRPSEPRQGRSASIPYRQGIRVDKAITIDKPREELYAFWRDLENLPRFMKHLRAVTRINDNVSHWVADGPDGKTVEWDAEINSEETNERIGWRSLPGSEVETAGSVHFKPAPDGRGTELVVELQYNPPGGVFGAAVAKLMGKDPGEQVSEDLRRLKQMLEAGEIATTEGQSRGDDVAQRREPGSERRASPRRRGDKVSQASEDSFPASDAPAWTGTRRDVAS
jgi:uncharacterized membrane protein